MEVFFLIAFLGMGAVLIFLFFDYQKKKTPTTLKALNSLLGGTLSSRRASTIVDGRPLEYGMVEKSRRRNAPYLFQYETAIEIPFEFELSLENRFDRLGKGLGLNSELQTQDLLFDEKFYVSSLQTEALRSFLESSERRRAIEGLLAHGFTRLSLELGRLTLRADSQLISGKSALSAEQLAEQAKKFIEFAKGIEEFQAPSYPPRVEPQAVLEKSYPFRVLTVLGLVGIPLFLWGDYQYPPLDSYPPFEFSLYFFIPCLVLSLWYFHTLVSNRSDGHKVLRIAFFSLLAIIGLGAYGLTLLYNGTRDPHPLDVHEVGIQKLYSEKQKGSRNYFVKLESWRTVGGSETLEISDSLYQELLEHLSELPLVRVSTGKGALGFEWLHSVDRSSRTKG